MMHPEAQRMAIATYLFPDTPVSGPALDYVCDMDDMRLAEDKLFEDPKLSEKYIRWMRKIALRDAKDGVGLEERLLRADVGQRAEAFLRTVNLWVE